MCHKCCANTTPELNLAPIEAFVQNRLETYLQHNDVPLELLEHLRQTYLMGFKDSKLTLADLEAFHV